jgi:hypothetical protein
MYTVEEKKEFRLKFWNDFKSYSSRKRRRMSLSPGWTGEKTGIKDLNLKFHFDEGEAIVAIDIVASDLDRRIALFEKVEGLKKLLEDAVGESLIWELDYTIESGKKISRIYLLKEGVNIYNMITWPDVMVFFFNKMIRIEAIVIEYKEYLKGLKV